MLGKLQDLSPKKQHIYSIIFSLLCMTIATGISSIYYYYVNENSANIALIFILFIIIISCNTRGYFYGIFCSLFTVVWFNYVYTYPVFMLNLSASGYPITFLVMTTIAVIISTLTSHLVLQSQMVKEQEHRLAEADGEKMRANLLRAISHDLRTPLSGIIGNSSMYTNGHASMCDAEKLEIVKNIQEDATWLFNMVENLLTVTRINNDDMTIKTNIESVEEVVGEAAMRVCKRHPDSSVNVDCPMDLIMIPMDAILIEQVIINLLENALKHSGKKNTVDLIVRDTPTNVIFTIRDYGNGIPEKKLNSLFDGTPYTPSQNADVLKGIGIGLVICKTIVTAHQGTIIGQNHDKGAEFVFTLPKLKEESL